MNRLEKNDFVNDFTGLLRSSSFVVVMNYDKLRFDNIMKLRRDLKKSDSSLSFVKNTLASISISNLEKDGVDMSCLKRFLKGPVCFVMGNDPVSVSKMVSNFTKEATETRVIAGFLEGKQMTLKDFDMYASLPTLDFARGMIVGMLQAVPSKIARVLNMKPE